MKNKNKFIIAGGGTGGHIFPAIAIANAIKEIMPNAKILFVGANGKMEMEKVPQAGYEIVGIDIAGYNRSSLFKNIFLPFKLVKSFFQVKDIFKSYLPDAVIGVGGYSSFPVLRYAQNKNIETYIHESNSYAGKSNMMLARNASIIFVASEGMEKFFPAEKIKITGNPVRKSIAEINIAKSDALNLFGLLPDKKVVLCVGGSLGAQSINEAIAGHVNLFEENNLQLIWQTGKQYFDDAKKIAATKKNIYVADFIKEMDYAYTAADIVISRSGAMAIAELCIVKKPVVFVPYPFAAEDHQTVNAENLVKKNAALMIRNSEASQSLIPSIVELSKNEDLQAELVKNISAQAIKNADKIIAEEILNS